MNRISLFVITAVVLTACAGGGGKKVLVMASGKFEINNNTNTITLKPGTTHSENSFVPTADIVSVISPSGTQEFDVKANGYYLLNLKKDTVSGAYQRIGKEGDAAPPPITQENLKFRIDSLYQLMINYNVADSNKQYNIPPFTIKKFTDNTDAEVFGPFRPVPPSFNPALDHEIYKFYTNKEIWDLILKLHRMTK